MAMGPWIGLYLEKSKGVFPGYLEYLAYREEIPIVLFLPSIGGDVDPASQGHVSRMGSRQGLTGPRRGPPIIPTVAVYQ